MTQWDVACFACVCLCVRFVMLGAVSGISPWRLWLYRAGRTLMLEWQQKGASSRQNLTGQQLSRHLAFCFLTNKALRNWREPDCVSYLHPDKFRARDSFLPDHLIYRIAALWMTGGVNQMKVLLKLLEWLRCSHPSPPSPERRVRVSLGEKGWLDVLVCQKLQINWTHRSLRGLFVL